MYINDPIPRRGVIAYTESDNAPARNKVWPRETISMHRHGSCDIENECVQRSRRRSDR